MRPRKERVTRLGYCQYLLLSQVNYTLTNYAEHTDKFSHDMANRYLAEDEVHPSTIWENIQKQVIDKNFSRKIELVRSQYSGNKHRVIKGIGVVICVYIKPQIDQF